MATTYPADYLAWLGSLESRFNITAGHIWEGAQRYERERIKEIIRSVGVQGNSDDWFDACDTIMEKIDDN